VSAQLAAGTLVVPKRPEWVQGSLSDDDTAFLLEQALAHAGQRTIEIGTGSGFSTAVLCTALEARAAAGEVDEDWRVATFDMTPRIYIDDARRSGDAARELLPQALLKHVVFRSPATATDARESSVRDEVGFMFIDANHQHPWPTLDLLAVLDILRPGATVVLHDINLPTVAPAFAAFGVKIPFDGLDVPKAVPDVPLPNIGAIAIPADKQALRDQLLALLESHPWEVEVDGRTVAHALDRHPGREP
jgi:predicted O-methyltransferase YrrM